MSNKYPILDTISDPADLRKLPRERLHALATELREFIVESVLDHWGPFSSNLGTVELTIALHYAYDTPNDRIVWDVGHQTIYKILDRPARRRGAFAPEGAASRDFRAARKVPTTLSGQRIHPRRFPPRWAWPLPRVCRASNAIQSP